VHLLEQMETRKLRWAVMGTSFISTKMVKAIRASDHGIVYCVAGRSLEKLHSFAEEFKIDKTYSDYDDLLTDSSVDVVYIGLPTYLHAEYTVKCARAGKHVLCDKSFTINAREAAAAIEAIRTVGRVFFMEAQMHRCHPIIPRLKAIVDERPLGRIISVDAVFTAPIVSLFNRHAGGSILDLGCYPISIMRYLFGEPVTVTGSAKIVQPVNPNENNFDEEATAIMELGDGITASVKSGNNAPLHWSFQIQCERGAISLANIWSDDVAHAVTLRHNDSGEEEHVVVAPPKSFYALEIDVVNRCILDGRVEASSPAMTWDDSLRNMEALDRWRSAIGLRYPMDSMI
jgi:predicted dehydrogenase